MPEIPSTPEHATAFLSHSRLETIARDRAAGAVKALEGLPDRVTHIDLDRHISRLHDSLLDTTTEFGFNTHDGFPDIATMEKAYREQSGAMTALQTQAAVMRNSPNVSPQVILHKLKLQYHSLQTYLDPDVNTTEHLSILPLAEAARTSLMKPRDIDAEAERGYKLLDPTSATAEFGRLKAKDIGLAELSKPLEKMDFRDIFEYGKQLSAYQRKTILDDLDAHPHLLQALYCTMTMQNEPEIKAVLAHRNLHPHLIRGWVSYSTQPASHYEIALLHPKVNAETLAIMHSHGKLSTADFINHRNVDLYELMRLADKAKPDDMALRKALREHRLLGPEGSDVRRYQCRTALDVVDALLNKAESDSEIAALTLIRSGLGEDGWQRG